MNCNIILILLINTKLYLARDYDLTCMYIDFLPGANIHCNPIDQALLASEYDKCETKSTPDLEYYQCIYKIYQIPTEQVDLLSKLHYTILKCKDCEYTHNWKFKNSKFCTNKAEVEYYKTYNDCLLNYINVNEEELGKKLSCAYLCYQITGVLGRLNCLYECYKELAENIVGVEPKITNFVNST